MNHSESLAWHLWAKSDRNKVKRLEDGRWLPVLTHLLDVAACTWELLDREPPRTLELLAGDYGMDVDQGRRWVCALAGLHDLGKASPTFQCLWDMAAKRPLIGVSRMVARPKKAQEVPHGQVTQLTLPALLECQGWQSKAAEQVADAVGCHHGQRSDQEAVKRTPDEDAGDGDWVQVRLTLMEQVLRGVGLDPDTAPAPPVQELSAAAYMRLAGLTSFADWVGSSFEVPASVDPLPMANPAAYVQAARVKARQKLDEIGWTRRVPLQDEVQSPDDLFSYIPGFSARALQTQLAGTLAKLNDHPALILVEAPMGEGKTEAGLHAATWLQRRAGHRGLYIALPTQATGNAMYTRFRKFLHHASRREIEPDLQLLHGGTLLNERYQKDIQRTLNPTSDPATTEEEHLNVRAESWFSTRKRAQLSEYGVGTVDQALLGVLGVPHQFVRLWGLGNRVVLLDEIHAYDTYTSRLIHALIAWLRALDSSVILMSATLPTRSRRALLDAWGAAEDTQPACYPRLTVAQGGKVTSQHVAGSRQQTPITVRALGAGAEDVAAKALKLAVNGGCVAVIVNTVQRAQDIFQAIRQGHAGNLKTLHQRGAKDDVCAILFHARYPAEDRERREKAVLKYLGPQPYHDDETPEKDYRPRRLILIATQVAEQSLDFDADVMITDLAPIDLMLQRAGRLHRHRANAERRHAHTTPTLWISGLDAWPDAPLEEQKWKWVYKPYLLYRSWLALQDGQTIRLPDHLDELVQQVYGETEWFSLSPEQRQQLSEAKLDFETKVGNDATLGGLAHIGEPGRFFTLPPVPTVPDRDGEPSHDDADPDWPTTRLGEPSIRIVPVHTRGQGFYLDPAFTLPARLGHAGTLTRKQALEIYRRSVRVARWQLVKFLPDQAPARPSWEADPLLGDCVPLVLIGGQADVGGGLTVLLDAELGVVYEQAPPVQSPKQG